MGPGHLHGDPGQFVRGTGGDGSTLYLCLPGSREEREWRRGMSDMATAIKFPSRHRKTRVREAAGIKDHNGVL